jgi:hypothetical protein
MAHRAGTAANEADFGFERQLRMIFVLHGRGYFFFDL